MEQEKSFYQGKIKELIILALVLGVIVLGALAILRDKIMQNNDYQFSVSAEGKATAKPDIANISFGFQTDIKKTVSEAVSEAGDRMNKVIAELVALKIDKNDIMTTQYNLNPIYSYAKDTGKQNLDGYQLSETVMVKIRNLDVIGEAIQKATAAGANQTGNIVFKIDNEDALKAAARSEAIKKAEAKAASIAQESGLKLGKLINVYEGGYVQPMFSNNFAYEAKAGSPASAAIPDVQSGQMEVMVNITLSYKVK
jgi:uncharacterized protein YggE